MPKSKKFWQFRNIAEKSAELLLYGDISDSTWWGDEVTPKQFAEELNALGAVTDISVRINSGGGDVFAAQTIGNLLEQHAANVTARIDGICASAATIVACHCNKVVAANDSTYMVHPAKMGLLGYYESKDLQSYIDALATIRDNIISLYAKKTGTTKDEAAKWMDATSWWTGAQAKEHGFVDELVDDEEEPVVENRDGVLFVNSTDTHLPFDKAPAALQQKSARQAPSEDTGSKTVQDRLTVPPAVGRSVNNQPAATPSNNKEETGMEIKTTDDLRTAYPDLVDQIEKTAAQRATDAERQRIKDIEEMALPGSEEFADKAKFTEPMDAAEFAKASMKNAKTQGAAWLEKAKDDAKGANGVKQTPPADKTTDEFMDALRSVNGKK